MAACYNGFKVVAIQDCDGRSLDFTLAAEQAIFGLIPAAIFLITAMLRVLYLSRQPIRTVDSLAPRAKLVVAFVFAAIQMTLLVLWTRIGPQHAELGIASSSVDLIAAAVLPVLAHMEDRRAVRPSTILSAYLAFTILLDLAQARTLWLVGFSIPIATMFASRLASKLVLLVFEVRSKRCVLKPEYHELPPEATAGIISRSFQFWLNGLFVTGLRSELSVDHLPRLDPDLAGAHLSRKFQNAWITRQRPERRLEFVYTVFRAFGKQLALAAFPRILDIGFTFAQVFLIQRTLTLLGEPATEESTSVGYSLIGATALIYLGLAVCKLHHNQAMHRFIIMFRGGAECCIYDHLLCLADGDGNKSATLTLMSTDLDRIAAALPEVNEVWSQTIEVIIGITLLSLQLGWVSVVPIVLVIFAFLGGALVTKTIGNKQKIWVNAVQARVSFTSSILAGMRNIKMLGLRDVIESMLQQYRIDETLRMAAFRWSILWQNVVQNLPWALTPALTFAIYAGQALARGDETLDAVTAFSSLAIIHLLTNPTAKLVSAIPSTASTIGCFDRIQAFLLTKPKGDQRSLEASSSSDAQSAIDGGIKLKDLTQIENRVPSSANAIQFENVTLRPAPRADPILTNMNLSVPHASLTILAGSVGAGKSSLLKSILGELPIEQGGSMTISDSRIAYCSQSPWLPNTTLKAAILGPSTAANPYDEARYKRCLRICDLDQDISQFENGDHTELGSNGSCLSGGQRHRVSLARALYSGAKMLILDDVFAALDWATQRKVCMALFGEGGFLRDSRTTTLLATSTANFLKYADKVLVLANGTVEETSSQEAEALQLKHASEASVTPVIVPPAQADVSKLKRAQQIDDLSRSTDDLAVYKYYSRHIHWFPGLFFLFSAAVNVFSSGFSQIWLKWWTEAGGARIGLHIGVFIGLAFLNSFSMGAYVWAIIVKISPSTARKFHAILVRTVMHAPQALFTSTDSGVILNRFTQDMTIIEGQLAIGVLVSVTNLFSALLAAGLVATGSSYMAATIPLLVFAIWALQKVYLRTSRQLRILDLEAKSPLYTHFAETASGLMTIRIFAWAQAFRDVNVELLDQSQRPCYLLYCIQRWLNLVLDLIVAAEAVLVVGLAVGIRGSTSPGLLGVSLNNVLSFSASLSNFLGGWTMLETSLGSIARLKGFEAAVQPEDRAEECVVATAQWPANGAIQFNNLSAFYEDSSSGVRDFSLTIEPGQTVGICGRTGSGKSSIISAMLRLVEIHSGTIVIDGIDITTLPRQVIRERLLVATQDPLIIPASLRVNIDPECNATDEALSTALERVGLAHLVERLGGFDHEVKADELSRGEQLLLSLARLILSKKSEEGILLLDEATSNLDADVEEAVQRVLKEDFEAYTKIVVAHHLHTILDSDVMVVMEQGSLVEAGSPKTLLQRQDGKLSKLMELQL
ncbi:ATP-binding cassette transporter, putative [Cordyceps militaris CM01]|uniref:ATP-binding cassette transporter, putative n=1 Tax=Cordyceps militaris (strain CM01) TaxID=983644 RepID=G3JPZ8_CORMM|nr:ATP-binding cassette transporter, putative [Cordyceps militaris CM01]EGX89249.1 ATP-binding cassette transporter, putative [Cordyceps militaris CM01]